MGPSSTRVGPARLYRRNRCRPVGMSGNDGKDRIETGPQGVEEIGGIGCASTIKGSGSISDHTDDPDNIYRIRHWTTGIYLRQRRPEIEVFVMVRYAEDESVTREE